jgi:hypothetical protein
MLGRKSLRGSVAVVAIVAGLLPIGVAYAATRHPSVAALKLGGTTRTF